MAAVLKSASINQTLRLASKAFLLSLIIFWLQSASFPVNISLIFIAVFAFFYTRPSLGNAKFISSAMILLIAPFFVRASEGPPEILFVIGWGTAFFLLVSIKNLIVLSRMNIYRIVHFAIVAMLSFFLVDRFGLTAQAVIFVALLFVFREFYINFSETDTEKKTLIAAAESFILIEISWMLSFLSTGILISVAFLTLFAFIFHDTTINRLRGTLNKEIVIRNGATFSILAIIIMIASLYK